MSQSDTTDADRIGAFPANYDTDALPERRTAAFARIMAIIAGIEAFAIIALAFAIAALMPLQKVVPMVVTSNDKGDEVIRINPASLASPTVDYVSEISLRDFVRRRYSIVGNAGEQAANWGLGSVVQLMSTPESYQQFMNAARAEYERLRQTRTIRSVRIDSVRKIGDRQNENGDQIFSWQVEYVTTDSSETGPLGVIGSTPITPSSRAWVSSFDIVYEAKNVTYSDRLNNPFGLTVLTVSDARRD